MKIEVVPGLARTEWHLVGALGLLISQAIIGLAALSVPPLMTGSGLLWYVGTFVGIAVIYVVIRSLRSSWWYLVWPVACLVSVTSFGVVDHPAAHLVVGLITLAFLFAGLTQRPGRSLWLLPLAALARYGAVDRRWPDALVALGIAAVFWSIASELPALLLRRLAEQQQILTSAAETDWLTGARNRRGLTELLYRMNGRAFVALLDLDQFKSYNDTHGHLAGDAVLVDFAAMLQRENRQLDVVIRYGGEEFLVVLANVDQRQAERIVQRWTTRWQDHASGVSFSGGLTDLTGDEALLRADLALYAAKAAGRARTLVIDSSGAGAPTVLRVAVDSPTVGAQSADRGDSLTRPDSTGQ